MLITPRNTPVVNRRSGKWKLPWTKRAHRLTTRRFIATRLVLRIIVVSFAYAIATMAFGWRAVPVVTAIYGLAQTWALWFGHLGEPRYTHAPATVAALGAAIGWGLVLALTAWRGGPVLLVAHQLAAVMQIPSGALFAVTFVLPALMAGSTMLVITSLRSSQWRRPYPTSGAASRRPGS